MNSDYKNPREKALAWWNDLEQNKKPELFYKYKSLLKFNTWIGRQYFDLTGREIEEIWKKENPIDALPDELINTNFEGIEEEHSE